MHVIASPERLARFSTRRPWTVVAIWATILVLSVVAASRVSDVLTSSAELYVGTDSGTANDLLTDRLYGTLPGRETIVVQSVEPARFWTTRRR